MNIKVTVIVPDYAVDDFRNQQYAPWFLGHYDDKQLDDDIILELYKEFIASLGDYREDDEHALYEFFPWLEAQNLGYVVLETGTNNYQILPVGEYDLEENDA